jgi:hypothetical protein
MVLTASLLLTVGCDNQYATRLQLTRESAQVTRAAVELLASVTDKASAESAAPKLEQLVARMADLDRQMAAFDETDEVYLGEENETILAEHAEWIAAQTRLMQEQQRIGANPELRAGLGTAWQDLTGGMYDPGGVMAAGGAMDLGTTRQLPGGESPPASVK